MLLTSVKSYGCYNAERIPALFTLSPTLENYKAAFTAVPLGRYLLNTLVFTVRHHGAHGGGEHAGGVRLCAAGIKGKNLVFLLFLSLMMIPNGTGGDHEFCDGHRPGTSETLYAGLILPSVTSVFYIYLLKENFEQVPDELYKAAKVDGTSDFKYLFKVMIPICRPTHCDHYDLKNDRVLEFLCMAAAGHG